jgi:hypothetical protein
VNTANAAQSASADSAHARWATRGILGLLLALLLLGAAGGSAQAAPSTAPALAAIDLDCKEAPLPAGPSDGLAGTLSTAPSKPVTGDPFSKGGPTLAEVYGYSYTWQVYDNGCGVTDGPLASWGTDAANLALGLSDSVLALTGSALSAVVDPSGWIGVLDEPMVQATQAIRDGLWGPWLGLSMMLVAVLILWRARVSQEFSRTINAGAWAVLVLVGVTVLLDYPVESTRAVDDVTQSVVTSVSNSFDQREDDGTASGAVNAQMDAFSRQVLYSTWAKGAFGDANSKTAQEYGPALFKASHLTWTEEATLKADPGGAGKEILDQKASDFEETADAVKNSDKRAYEYLTGNESRFPAAEQSLVLTVLLMPFLLLAGIIVLVSYLVIRLGAPLAPVLGLLGILEPLQSIVTGAAKKIGSVLFAGPVFWVGANVNLIIASAILNQTDEEIAWWLRYGLAAAAGILLWMLLKPAAFFTGAAGGAARNAWGAFRDFQLIKAGTKGIRDRQDREHGEEKRQRDTRAPERPSYAQGFSYPSLAANASDRETRATRPDSVYVGNVTGHSPHEGSQAAASTTPGTFVHREVAAPAPATELTGAPSRRGVDTRSTVRRIALDSAASGDSESNEETSSSTTTTGAAGGATSSSRNSSIAGSEPRTETSRGQAPGADRVLTAGGKHRVTPVDGVLSESRDADTGGRTTPRPASTQASTPLHLAEHEAVVDGQVTHRVPDGVAESNSYVDPRTGRTVYEVWSPMGSEVHDVE